MLAPTPNAARTRVAPRVLAILVAALLPSCITPPPFHERGRLADAIMHPVSNPTEAHWYAKVIHSMEGSVGAVGGQGGGGCGCY